MRRQALRDTLDAIVELAASVNADALLCGGDLYEHERVAPDTSAVIREAFARIAPIPVLVAPGNHDWYGPQSLYRHTEWSENVHIFDEDRLQPYELVPGLAVWGAAHKRPAGTKGFLDDFEVDQGRDDIHLALFHGSLRSGLPFEEEEDKQPHAPFDAEQIPDAGLHHALLGHFHTPKDGDWHTYPGNPDPLAFGETGERGVVIVDIQEDGEVARTRHVVAQTEVSDVTVDVTGCSSQQEVRAKTEAALENLSGIARVTLEGEVSSDVDVSSSLEGIADHLAAVVSRLGHITVAHDFDAIAQESTVRGQFVQDVRSAGLEPDMERRVLITGLRALEGRRDLGVD